METRVTHDKVLTVSVAAYNMSDYIEQCLDSCLCGESMDNLEVIIVDDGSTDDTAIKVERYITEYPGTFRLIRQENGGYGSTVNVSMRLAQGRYFRLLDADDWFVDGALDKLVPSLIDAVADVVVTPMFRCPEGDEPIYLNPGIDYVPGSLIDTTQTNEKLSMNMWCLTVRTEILRNDPFVLPGHRVFTDQLFVINSLVRARTFTVIDVPLYCYRIGREGQSVSLEQRIRKFDDIENALIDEMAILRDYETGSRERTSTAATLGAHYSAFVKLMLALPRSWKNLAKIRALDLYLREELPEVYEAASTRRVIRMLRNGSYLGYWPLTLLDMGNQRYWSPRRLAKRSAVVESDELPN